MNPLVVDKISKKFLWEKDSGFIYTRQLMDKLPSNWRFTVLTPKGFNPKFFPNVECVEYDYSTSIHQNRYHFNRNILAKALPYSKDIDVIINMQPEVTANLKTFFYNQRRESPIIINYFHWIDCHDNESNLSGYIWRQVEGVRLADLSMFHSDHALKLFMDYAVDNDLPLGQFDCAFFRPQPTKFGETPFELPNKKIILFNHRLNSTTGWKEIVKICDIVRKENDFVLWITDDQNLREKKWLEGFDWIRVIKIPLDNYGYLIKNSHFSIANPQGYETWNMAVLDSINHGTSVLAKHTPLMSELGAFTTGDMENAIRKLLDESKIIPKNKVIEDDYDLERFIDIKIKERVKNKNPKKYDDVKNMIIERKGWCEKKDFVNEFWSFHANSNFQLIRWKLLTEGFKDNTILPFPRYSKP